MLISRRRWIYSVWLLLICIFAVLHGLNLRADFPKDPHWYVDGAMYTDEGWWASAAIHAHLTGHWHSSLDYNPAPAVPAWPFLVWVLFFFTGVSIEAARALAVAFFFANMVLSYLLLRHRGPPWMALLALSLMVTSPFLYAFSRLAILEPMLMTLTLAALNLAVRLPRFRHPVRVSIVIGLLFAFMMLTKTSAVCLLPALGWSMLLPLRTNRKLAVRCALGATVSSVFIYGLWMTLVVCAGAFGDFRNFFYVNEFSPPMDFHRSLDFLRGVFSTARGADHILIPLSAAVFLAAAWAWRSAWARRVLLDPVFGASIWAIVGYLLFMVYHYYSPPRYFAVVAVFCFLVVAQGAGSLLGDTAPAQETDSKRFSFRPATSFSARPHLIRLLGWAVIALAVLATGVNGAKVIGDVTHPEYSFVNAYHQLTQFIDDHPDGKRLLASTSGDEITLFTNLPAICAPTSYPPCNSLPDPASGLADDQPGWYAEWNAMDRTTLEVIHTHFSLEQVASFRAFDDPERDVLVLFKLHPLPSGRIRNPAAQNLRIPLPDDKIDIPIF